MSETTKTQNGIPQVISIRTDELAPLLAKWRNENKEVAWSRLLARALRKELAPLAGKRHAHLVQG